ncbi:MAG: type II toxin-antitoxin system HicA family toxin [Thermomicrobiales bacterium]
MTKRDKLVRRIRQRPPEADFDDVRAVLDLFGWTFDRQRGSHASFTKPGEGSITVPISHGKVKRAYLDHLCEALGLDNEDAN